MLVQGHKFTIGADPEVFVKDALTNTFVSAHDLVPGTKSAPFAVPKGAVQVDGLALEFNIDPAESYEEFEENLLSVKDVLGGMIGDKQFLEDVSVHFDKTFAAALPPESLVLGCEADYNGWTGYDNPSVDGGALMRTAGGHVHIGGFETDNPFNQDHFDTCARLSRILDETLGAYSILWDKDDQRRSMYGKAGSFRPKKYGMEYRTLSNQWIFNPKLIKFVFDAVQRGLEHMFDPNHQVDERVRNIIDTSDRTSDFFVENKHIVERLA